MKNVLLFNGSPRKNGNTAKLAESFLNGAATNGSNYEEIVLEDAEIKFCQGCLRCNILGYCSLRDDDWQDISAKIDKAEVLVFATPIYFHHVTAQMKRMLDRFRSFIKIKITEEGLKHTPHHNWEKEIVLLLVMGSSDDIDAEPVIELFKYMIKIMGDSSGLHVLKGNRLAVSGQISMDEKNLTVLYKKLGLGNHLISEDLKTNKDLLTKAYELGARLSK